MNPNGKAVVPLFTSYINLLSLTIGAVFLLVNESCVDLRHYITLFFPIIIQKLVGNQ